MKLNLFHNHSQTFSLSLERIIKKNILSAEDYFNLNKIVASGFFKSNYKEKYDDKNSLEIVFTNQDYDFIDFLSKRRQKMSEVLAIQHTADLFFSRKSIDLGIEKSKKLTIKEIIQRPIPTAANILVEWTGDKYVVLAAEHNSYINEHLFHGEEKTIEILNNKKNNLFKNANISSYPSLEPCSKRFGIDSCSELLVKNNIKRVIIPSWDSNPKQMFGSLALLLNANIEVVFLHELEKIALKQNYHMPIGKLLQSNGVLNNSGLFERIKRVFADAKYFWFGIRQKVPFL